MLLSVVLEKTGALWVVITISASITLHVCEIVMMAAQSEQAAAGVWQVAEEVQRKSHQVDQEIGPEGGVGFGGERVGS